MRLYEIIGHNCGGNIHYDPTKRTIRINKKVRAKITLRSLRKMNLLKNRQSKINKKKNLLVGLMYGTGSNETQSDMSLAAELKSQNHITDMAINYIKKSF